MPKKVWVLLLCAQCWFSPASWGAAPIEREDAHFASLSGIEATPEILSGHTPLSQGDEFREIAPLLLPPGQEWNAEDRLKIEESVLPPPHEQSIAEESSGYPLPFWMKRCPVGENTVENFYDPFSLQYVYGPGCPEPYRLGWLAYEDGAYFIKRNTSGVSGSLQITEWNSWLRYATRLSERWIGTWTGVSNARYWQGPAGVGFPSTGAQLQSDFQLSYLSDSQWTAQIGFTPQINSDFQRGLTSQAYMFDGRGVILMQASPKWTVGIGAAYWNRARDYFIPYGGLIWYPGKSWEVKMMFPESRLAYYMGNYWGAECWSYTSVDFNVEAYQVSIESPRTKDLVEFRDYRWMKGFYAHRGNVQFFMEGGGSFGRQVSFRGSTPDFSMSESFLWRAGVIF